MRRVDSSVNSVLIIGLFLSGDDVRRGMYSRGSCARFCRRDRNSGRRTHVSPHAGFLVSTDVPVGVVNGKATPAVLNRETRWSSDVKRQHAIVRVTSKRRGDVVTVALRKIVGDTDV